MNARLTTLARRWNVSLVTTSEHAHASGLHNWQASAVSADLPRSRPEELYGCLLTNAPTREAALFKLKAAIDDARKPEVLAA